MYGCVVQNNKSELRLFDTLFSVSLYGCVVQDNKSELRLFATLVFVWEKSGGLHEKQMI